MPTVKGDMKKLLAPAFILTILLAACGSGDITLGQEPDVVPTTLVPDSEPTTEPRVTEPSADAGPMLVLHESGGCYQAGPYCRSLSFWADGRVDVAWPAEAERPVETHAVDPALATAWLEIAAATDFDELVSRLPEGECQGCFDGIDTVLEVSLDGRNVTLDSLVVEFVDSEPLFSATNNLASAVPFELGEAPISSDPADWNSPIDPQLTVEGLAGTVSAELPVVQMPGRALGGGLLNVSISGVSVDSDYVYLEIGRSAGCAEFEHLAAVPTAEAGVYELFYDTDNVCEAFTTSGYRTPRSDLLPAADGTITIIDGRGTATTVALN